MQDTRIPLTLLTGFLGSGKTTLLNHWVKQQELGECAVLINAFGSVQGFSGGGVAGGCL